MKYLMYHLMLFYDVQVYFFTVLVGIKSKYINEKSFKHFMSYLVCRKNWVFSVSDKDISKIVKI